MTQFKGTQGKWHLMKKGFTKNANDNLIQVYATNEDLEFVCQVWKDGILHDKTQNFEANAQLISKAPEMLEMLQKCKEYFLLKTDKYSEERADAIGQLINEATKID